LRASCRFTRMTIPDEAEELQGVQERGSTVEATRAL
jgi:hypothetical protein